MVTLQGAMASEIRKQLGLDSILSFAGGSRVEILIVTPKPFRTRDDMARGRNKPPPPKTIAKLVLEPDPGSMFRSQLYNSAGCIGTFMHYMDGPLLTPSLATAIKELLTDEILAMMKKCLG